jgi:peptidyl-prolyl cis-trans isomerase B (cyclophilin B)
MILKVIKMKKKIFNILFMLLAVLSITACGKKESEEKIVKEEILKGIVDDYKFTVTDEVTDRVRIQMNNGDIMLVVLSNSQTPVTIENFKNHVQKGTYDGLIFHRVIENFMIQGGDPTGTGYGDDSIPTIKGEFSSNGVQNDMKHTRGVLSMARANNPNSASSQFFIVHKDSSHLDGEYAAFGKVFAGLDVLDKIATTKTDGNDRPISEQKIKSIKFITVEKA